MNAVTKYQKGAGATVRQPEKLSWWGRLKQHLWGIQKGRDRLNPMEYPLMDWVRVYPQNKKTP